MLGRTISHYRVLAELARGGTGVVYAAEDLRGGHQVALKVFTMDLAGASEALACSHRGAAIVASLHHPNVCAIHEIGEVDGRPFLAMERLEGTTLRELARRKPLSVDRVLELAQEIVAALAAGHRRGIIHRNITPASVFVTHAGQVKLLGFGLAQILEETASAAEAASPSTTTTARSHDGLAQPTVPPDAMAYMSPEQVRGDTLEARTDLFSFGAVLHELVREPRAAPGREIVGVLDVVLHRTSVPARGPTRAVPEDLEPILDKATERDRDLRYQRAADLLADLRRLRRNREAGDDVELSLSAHGGTPPEGAAATTIQARSTNRRSARRLVVAVGAGAAVLLALAFALLRPGSPPALTERDSVLLADFENGTTDAAFDGTLRQALAVQLSQSPFLDLVPDQRIRETLRLMGRSPDASLTHDVALEICERQGLRAMLEASIAQLGGIYVVTLDATECATGETLARDQAEADRKEEVLRAVGRVASGTRAKLGESMASLQRSTCRSSRRRHRHWGRCARTRWPSRSVPAATRSTRSRSSSGPPSSTRASRSRT